MKNRQGPRLLFGTFGPIACFVSHDRGVNRKQKLVESYFHKLVGIGALNLAAGIDCSITPTSARAIPHIHDPVSLVLNCQTYSTWRSAVPANSGWPSISHASFPWRKTT